MKSVCKADAWNREEGVWLLSANRDSSLAVSCKPPGNQALLARQQQQTLISWAGQQRQCKMRVKPPATIPLTEKPIKMCTFHRPDLLCGLVPVGTSFQASSCSPAQAAPPIEQQLYQGRALVLVEAAGPLGHLHTGQLSMVCPRQHAGRASTKQLRRGATALARACAGWGHPWTTALLMHARVLCCPSCLSCQLAD